MEKSLRRKRDTIKGAKEQKKEKRREKKKKKRERKREQGRERERRKVEDSKNKLCWRTLRLIFPKYWRQNITPWSHTVTGKYTSNDYGPIRGRTEKRLISNYRGEN